MIFSLKSSDNCLGNLIMLSIVHQLDNIMQRNSTATNSCKTITCHIYRRRINARSRISPTCIQTYATLPTSHHDGYDRDAIRNMLAKSTVANRVLESETAKAPNGQQRKTSAHVYRNTDDKKKTFGSVGFCPGQRSECIKRVDQLDSKQCVSQ